MHIDDTTLADLEVLGTRAGSAGLIGLLDHTETSLGRRALRRRLTHPLAQADAIRDMQVALRTLADSPGVVRLDEVWLLRVRDYLDSTIQVASGSALRVMAISAWVRLRYADQRREIGQGQMALRETFVGVADICARLTPESDTLGRLLGFLEDVADRVLSTIAQRSLLEADRILRRDLADDIADALELIGDLDALNAMAIAGGAEGWTTPELVDSEAFLLDVDGAVHPLVDQAVPNPVRLDGGEPLVFLTGPNMAGKTTYLRTVGLLVLLAQTGMNVPAGRMRLAPVDALLTSLNPSDNLTAGVSYFMAEVLRVRDAARLVASGRRSLVLFDEVFKGTNVRDALDASSQVILGFANARRSGSIFSSHLSELAETFAGNPAIRLRRFGGEVVDGRPRFAYELERGVSDKRMGLLLLEQARVPELLRAIGG